jgi:hypothetical protein
MPKPVVHYDPDKYVNIQVGYSAFVTPFDHPGEDVSNTKTVITSPVRTYDQSTGEFETLNTIYKPKYIS